MFPRIALVVAIYAAAVLDTSDVHLPGGNSVYWLSLVVVGLVWSASPGEACLWGMLIGLLSDATSGHRMGAEVLVCSTLGFLLADLRQRWDCRSLLSLTLLAVAATASLLIAPLAFRCIDVQAEETRIQMHVIVRSAAATVTLALLMALVLRAFLGCFGPFLSRARA